MARELREMVADEAVQRGVRKVEQLEVFQAEKNDATTNRGRANAQKTNGSGSPRQGT